ncbi:MAG TPA: hypothetical protein VFY43_06385, partial [Candidatus Limnocylindria bacterium]|nr:hypothetical protein [Candidatus Limnocylindria bacterium]
MILRPAGRVARLPGLLLVLALVVAACAPVENSGTPAASPAVPVGDASLELSQGPNPGPLKPFRGEMAQHIRIVDGYVSMFFELRNVGEEPVTFLNTLYDYEPDQLYTPAVRLEWQEGGNLIQTRAGRFFPSPAILEPGQTGAYLMGGQPAQGNGTIGDLVTHIKYCPTRGMDDIPSVPVDVSDLDWSSADGVTTVSGTLTLTAGPARPASPTVGVAFFDAADDFLGAVVS